MGLACSVPGGTGFKGLKFIASAATTGGVIAGLQPTADGQLSTRFENAAKGAVEKTVLTVMGGAIIKGVGQPLLKLYDTRKVLKFKPDEALAHL